MNNAFYLSFFAGLSTVFGTVFLFIKFKNENLLIGRALSFTSGVMISVSVLDLIPTAFVELRNVFYIFPVIIITFIFIIIGIIITIISNKIFPNNNSMNNNRLYKTGIFSMIAIMLHNIPEDCSCYVSR